MTMNKYKPTDEIFSKYIRARDGFGNSVRCFICGKMLLMKEAHCGHFIPVSRGLAHRWNPDNAKTVCSVCNCSDDEHYKKFRAKLVEERGEESVAELERDAISRDVDIDACREKIRRWFKDVCVENAVEPW